MPVVPVVPIYPPTPNTPRHAQRGAIRPTSVTPKSVIASPPAATEADQQSATPEPTEPSATPEESSKVISPPRPPPKSWADLVRPKAPATSGDAVASTVTSGLVISKNESLVDVINNLGSGAEQYSNKIAFVEPRGLVNTGNMCYMNSVSLVYKQDLFHDLFVPGSTNSGFLCTVL
jgi:ubiquitin carboxyl-terminal hydrolase 10